MTEAKKSSKDEVDLSKISSPEQLLELAGDDKLKIEQLKTLVEIHPQIVQGAIEAMQSLAKVSTIAGNSQTEAIKTIKESISGTVDILKIIAQNAESDKTRERIAELLLELAKQRRIRFQFQHEDSAEMSDLTLVWRNGTDDDNDDELNDFHAYA